MADLIIDSHAPALGETATATFSPCRTYRYALTRRWSDAPIAVWIMLNPSTADAFTLDPTLRRVQHFSRTAWNAGGFTVLNLYGLRATDPAHLLRHPEPIGPDNDAVIALHLSLGPIGRLVAGWGAHRMVRNRADQILSLAKVRGIVPCCLGTSKDGWPRHPLYLRNDTVPVRFDGPTHITETATR